MGLNACTCVYDEKPDKMKGGERSGVQYGPDPEP